MPCRPLSARRTSISCRSARSQRPVHQLCNVNGYRCSSSLAFVKHTQSWMMPAHSSGLRQYRRNVVDCFGGSAITVPASQLKLCCWIAPPSSMASCLKKRSRSDRAYPLSPYAPSTAAWLLVIVALGWSAYLLPPRKLTARDIDIRDIARFQNTSPPPSIASQLTSHIRSALAQLSNS